MSHMNRIANCKNEFQGKIKKILCVCSAGLLRSPSAAVVLSQEPFNYNTRAVGLTEEYALIPVDDVLLHWADEVVCMEEWMKEGLVSQDVKHVICLDIPDKFAYRDPELMELIAKRYNDPNHQAN